MLFKSAQTNYTGLYVGFGSQLVTKTICRNNVPLNNMFKWLIYTDTAIYVLICTTPDSSIDKSLHKYI